jgi:hypothetical protein
MQLCSNCNANQYDGTIFCTECGASLLQAERRSETTASLGQRLAELEAPLAATIVPAPAPEPQPSHALWLTIINSGRRLCLPATRPLLVGRQDAARGVYPDLDLSTDGGYDAGVSRRHARIWHQSDGYVVEDLASANGTFVNGQRLSPNSPTSVSSGDELGFGTLLVRIETA